MAYRSGTYVAFHAGGTANPIISDSRRRLSRGCRSNEYITAPALLSDLWPTALSTRIRSGAAHVIHLPFKPGR